ncbi:MAG: hypothetical protein WCL29_03585 [Pseudomonadota bacterium]
MIGATTDAGTTPCERDVIDVADGAAAQPATNNIATAKKKVVDDAAEKLYGIFFKAGSLIISQTERYHETATLCESQL